MCRCHSPPHWLWRGSQGNEVRFLPSFPSTLFHNPPASVSFFVMAAQLATETLQRRPTESLLQRCDSGSVRHLQVNGTGSISSCAGRMVNANPPAVVLGGKSHGTNIVSHSAAELLPFVFTTKSPLLPGEKNSPSSSCLFFFFPSPGLPSIDQHLKEI